MTTGYLTGSADIGAQALGKRTPRNSDATKLAHSASHTTEDVFETDLQTLPLVATVKDRALCRSPRESSSPSKAKRFRRCGSRSPSATARSMRVASNVQRGKGLIGNPPS